MKGRAITKTEYLLRTVRESEHMSGWQDAFSKMREEITKEVSAVSYGTEREAYEAEEVFEK